MSQYHLRWGALASLVYLILSAIAPAVARAEVPLTRAEVDSFQNQVEILLRGGPTRPVRPSDWLSVGDAIRTYQASQVDLRFNDGSLARVGELATFWFVPNTRNFRLSNGTALLLIPPGNGRSTIETPNVVTGIQGTALVVRHVPAAPTTITTKPDLLAEFEQDAGRTAVMVLTDSPAGPVEVRLRDGRQVPLSAGQMAIVDNGNLYLFEFDLALFYETSPLVEGLNLDNPDFEGSGEPTDPVRQETWEGLSEQQDFEGDYLLNPTFLSPEQNNTAEEGWLYPASALQNPPTRTPTETTPSPTTLPHGTSGTPIELVPPADADFPPGEVPVPSGEGEDSPSGFPPGLINPSPGDSPLSPEPPVTEPPPVEPPPVEPPPVPELPPADDDLPDFDDDFPGDDDDEFDVD